MHVMQCHNCRSKESKENSKHQIPQQPVIRNESRARDQCTRRKRREPTRGKLSTQDKTIGKVKKREGKAEGQTR